MDGVLEEASGARSEDEQLSGEAEWDPNEVEDEDEGDGIESEDFVSEEEEEGAPNDFFRPRKTRNRAHSASNGAQRTQKTRKRKAERTPRGERARNRRREIADVMDDAELDDSTIQAREAEARRAERIEAILGNFSTLSEEQLAVAPEEKQTLCLNPVSTDGTPPTGEEGAEDEPVFVYKDIVNKLKPHQIAGARFLWGHIAVEPNGFGCVLADFMGLGKTLQVITTVQAFLNKKTKDENGEARNRHKHVLILAPTICVRNWEAEVVKWLGKKEARRMGLHTLESSREKKMSDRVRVVKTWHKRGGVLIMGYELYRILVLQSSGDEKIAAGNQKYAHLIKQVYPCLSDPGPDLIVLDEGHRVRDHKSKMVKALKHVKTSRRIILTGYPLQNHLEEYWTMVNFARQDYLGSLEEFKNRFVDPIKNGQCIDSSDADLRLARQRAFVLTRELKPLVLRRDQQYLFKQLPPKKEYVLMCKLTDAQAELYRTFLECGVPKRGKNQQVDVLGGYHISLAISNHPDVLLETFKQLQEEVRNGTFKKKVKRNIFGIEDGDDDYDPFSDMLGNSPPVESRGTRVVADSSDECEEELLNALDAPSKKTRPSPSTSDVWHRLLFAKDYMEKYVPKKLESSGKMMLLMQILSECQDIGDRVILFSQSIPTLNTIALMISKHNKYQRRHSKRLSYLRIDGSTPQQDRFRQIAQFNDLEEDVDLIMISTKAGGEGINLCAGNRIIIFDVCWNPCNDSQSMCRSYRFGQTKPVYVYRFVTAGTMEKKVYDLQIRKEGVAKRIVDEKTMERKFKSSELQNYFDVQDFENSLQHAQGKAVDDDVQAIPQTDPVLLHLLRDNQERTTTVTVTEDGEKSTLPERCIIDWFEQETMFEEDLDQQCTPTEQKEIIESYTYLKAVRGLRKKGTHLISRDGVLVKMCDYCRSVNEVYPAETTGVPVPSKIECNYCKQPTTTTGAVPPAANTTPGNPFLTNVPGYPLGGVPTLIPTGLNPGLMPGAVPLVAPVQNGRVIPAHLQSVYLQQQQQSQQSDSKVADNNEQQKLAQQRAEVQQLQLRIELERQRIEAQRQLAASEEAKRRKERLSMKLGDRHLLVIRRGVKGCQELKRQAEECGATMAIEINSQLTDIVSGMSKAETLKWLKVTKLPRDVELHDDTWLRNEIAKEKGLPLIPTAASSASSDVKKPIANTAAAAAVANPVASTPTLSQQPNGTSDQSPQTTADTSSDFIELLDSDDEAPPKAVFASEGAGSNSSIVGHTPTGVDDDDDVIEIF
ncbi:hypothetical protein PHYBOEH_001286 [Phytophthora boehmeriae]|uniref:Transcriptional regulator ATRX n=1 Tax=Phytophthora boehmeriae TaxID=109152 RepID=A0A8T1WSL1_9STRA|nr:hypothetical protein PHYBOEH_001286 [Phytophthora boehmeriae]